jgi:TfoX/Sxy family transcriptional regulator of competence genes
MEWEKASPELVELLAEALAPIDHEKRSMFGMPAYFIHGNLFAGVHGRNVMIRLALSDQDEINAQHPGVGRFEPMPGRPMKEYVTLPASLYDDPEEFDRWLRRAQSFAASLPPKEKKPPRKKHP